MRLLFQAWYRWGDRELDRQVSLPERDSLSPGDWNRLVGMTGERLARKYLWRIGRKVLYQNYRAEGGGEIDLIYRDGATLVFGEVKTRTSAEFGDPARAVDHAKEQLLIRGANAWIRELNYPALLFRFDIIEILLLEEQVPQVRVIENAFTTPQMGLGM